jgi:cell division protein FtsI/penicillin-binding protein 2
MSVSRTIVPNRGTITDRYGEVLASSQPAVTVIADPTQIATNGKLASAMTAKDRRRPPPRPARSPTCSSSTSAATTTRT